VRGKGAAGEGDDHPVGTTEYCPYKVTGLVTLNQ